MASGSSILFSLGVHPASRSAFAAHVGHAVMLANGRRLAAALGARPPAGLRRAS